MREIKVEKKSKVLNLLVEIFVTCSTKFVLKSVLKFLLYDFVS